MTAKFKESTIKITIKCGYEKAIDDIMYNIYVYLSAPHEVLNNIYIMGGLKWYNQGSGNPTEGGDMDFHGVSLPSGKKTSKYLVYTQPYLPVSLNLQIENILPADTQYSIE